MVALPTAKRRWMADRQIWMVLLLTVLIRGSFLGLHLDDLRQDPDGYLTLARNLANTGTFGFVDDSRPSQQNPVVRSQPKDTSQSGETPHVLPTAYRPPGYPLLIAGALQLPVSPAVSIAVVHTLLGLLTVAATILLGRELGLGRTAAIAGLLVAADPILLNQSRLVMTETLAALLATVGLWCLVRATKSDSLVPCGLAGVLLATASLCRPTFLPFLLVAGMLLACPKTSTWPRWDRPLLCILAAVAIYSPWIWRNWIQFGAPIVATTHGGITLHWGNNPSYFAFVRKGNESNETWRDVASLIEYPDQEDDPYLHEAGPRGELARNRYHYLQARKTIRANPAGFIAATGARLREFWQVVPPRDVVPDGAAWQAARMAIGVWYAVVFAAAVAGLVRLGAAALTLPWLWPLTLVLSFAAVHAVYWSNMRMRAGVVPAVALVAAAGVLRREKTANEPVRLKSEIVKDLLLLPAPSAAVDRTSSSPL